MEGREGKIFTGMKIHTAFMGTSEREERKGKERRGEKRERESGREGEIKVNSNRSYLHRYIEFHNQTFTSLRVILCLLIPLLSSIYNTSHGIRV